MKIDAEVPSSATVSCSPQRGQPEGGQPAGDVAEHADPVGGQVHRPADDDRADHRDQRAGDPAGDHRAAIITAMTPSDTATVSRGPGAARPPSRASLITVCGLGAVTPSMSGSCPMATWMPDPGEEAEQHGAGQEVGQEAEPGQPGQQQQPAGEQRASPASPTYAADAGVGQPDQRAGQDGRGGRVRRHDQVPGRTQHGEHGQRQQQRVQAGHHRHPGDPRVAEHLGDAQRGQRDPGQQVPGQRGPADRQHPAQHRPAPQPREPAHPPIIPGPAPVALNAMPRRCARLRAAALRLAAQPYAWLNHSVGLTA